MKYVTCENTNLDLAFLHSDTIVYLPVSIVTTSLKRITAGTVALAWKRGWLKSSPRTCSWCTMLMPSLARFQILQLEPLRFLRKWFMMEICRNGGLCRDRKPKRWVALFEKSDWTGRSDWFDCYLLLFPIRIIAKNHLGH